MPLLEKNFSHCWTSARIHILKTWVSIRDGSCLYHMFLGTLQVWRRRVSLMVIFHQGLVMEKCLDFNSCSFNYSIYNLSIYCAFPWIFTCDQGTRDIVNTSLQRSKLWSGGLAPIQMSPLCVVLSCYLSELLLTSFTLFRPMYFDYWISNRRDHSVDEQLSMYLVHDL